MKQLIKGLMVLLIVVSWQPAMATDHWASVEVTNVEVADGIYMLQGEGGNVGVSVGEDGTFIIDDQYAEMTAKLLTAIKSLSGEAPKFLINTHWHGDHAGGNENFGRKGAIIVAHENVRESLKVEKSIPAFNMHKPPSPKEALPVVTFRQQMSLHFNGDDVRLFHVANAHTDGDAVVYFERANVIHTGDTFFNGFYPFIDTASGGSLAGMIAASAAILEMANEQTRIIPGHGPLATRADLQTYHDMLVQAETAIGSLVKAGKSADEVVAAKPTAALDGGGGPPW